jgi:hypothetical protein
VEKLITVSYFFFFNCIHRGCFFLNHVFAC